MTENRNTASVVVAAATNNTTTAAVLENRKRRSYMNTEDDVRDDLKLKRSRLIERLVVLRRFCAG